MYIQKRRSKKTANISMFMIVIYSLKRLVKATVYNFRNDTIKR